MATKQRKRPAVAPGYCQRGTLVQVTWLDAAFDLDKEAPLLELNTWGHVIRHNADVICVASEGDNAGYYRSYTTIPAGWIVRITKLGPLA